MTPFDDADARAAWGDGAAAWREFVTSGADWYRTLVHGPALLDACAVRRGERALDLGCGEGWFARRLAHAGADVTGVDLSPALLEFACTEEQRAPLGIAFIEGSATQLDTLVPAGAFDLAAACMSLQDMSDPAACLRGAHTALAANGRFVFSIPHPATDMPVRTWERDADGRKVMLKVDRYFESGPAECRWNMPRLAAQWTTPFWRHTLEEWFAVFADAGFRVERLQEPRPDADTVAAHPELEDCARVPYFLIIELRKRGEATPE